MKPSIFTRIINGEIPCHKVYEDDATLAFMDIYPIQPGAVLVVPKKQIDHFFDLPDQDYLALMTTVKMLAKRMKTVFSETSRIGVIIEGFEVAHAHVKLIPIQDGHELRHLPDMTLNPNHNQLATQAARLAL